MVKFWWMASYGLQMVYFLLCPHMVVGARELCGASFLKALILIIWALPLWPNHLPKFPSPNTITLEIVLTYKVGEHTCIQSIAFKDMYVMLYEWERGIANANCGKESSTLSNYYKIYQHFRFSWEYLSLDFFIEQFVNVTESK